MKKKTILLLHGFKRNGIDDFAEMHDYFSNFSEEYNIENFVYFDNYDRSTLNERYLNNKVDELSKKLSNQKKILIIGYSTGSIVAAMIAKKLPKNVDVKIFAMVPPIKIVLMKWIPMGYRIRKKEKALKRKIGKERYNSIKNKAQKNKNMEKYPLVIAKYINVLRKKHQKVLLTQENVTYLLAKDDTFVHTKRIIKKLNRYKRKYVVDEFKHDLLLKKDKNIFIKWFENEIKN